MTRSSTSATTQRNGVSTTSNATRVLNVSNKRSKRDKTMACREKQKAGIGMKRRKTMKDGEAIGDDNGELLSQKQMAPKKRKVNEDDDGVINKKKLRLACSSATVEYSLRSKKQEKTFVTK